MRGGSGENDNEDENTKHYTLNSKLILINMKASRRGKAYDKSADSKNSFHKQFHFENNSVISV